MEDTECPRCLQNSFCSSLHYIFDVPKKEKERRKKRKTGGQTAFQWAGR
jgi:hypothetical protein